MKSVSDAYIDGIKEGRASYKHCNTMEEIKSAAETDLHFCDNVSTCAYSATQQDYIRGLRDFWKNQLSKIA